MRYRSETVKRVSRVRKVSRKVFRFTIKLINAHLKFPAAKNSLYTSSHINHCLLQLSLSEGYAESGLTNLSVKCNPKNKVPTGRTFRGRVERLQEKEIREALIQANDQALGALKSRGVFKRRATVAIDFTRDLFYGNPNTKNVIGGKQERGTTWGYCYASIDIVEAGRRLTLYTMTVNQFTEKAHVVEKLISEAKARGVHIRVVLLDRAFFTIDVITALKRLGVRFIMPAVKNNKVKQTIRNYKEGPVKRFVLGNRRKNVSFNLAIYPRPEQRLPKKKKLTVYDLYFGFATNIPMSSAANIPAFIPSDYRRRWGIETGYRVQGSVKAKTTSKDYRLRLAYQMTSVLLYNVWHYANFLVCQALKKPFVKPILKLTRLATHLELLIIGGLGPPQH